MKVLFISSDNSNRSGAFLSMCKLAYLLRENHGVECRIILPFDGDGTSILEEYNIEYKIIRSYDWIIPIDCGSRKADFVMRVKKYIKYLINIRSISQIIDYIKKYDPDIVHINTICSYVGAIAAIKLDKPLIWHVREFLEEDQKNKIHFQKIGYRIINRANCIVCISDSVKSKFEKILDKEKLITIYNGVSKEKFSYSKKREKDKIIITCVGGLYPHKGQETLIKAVKKLKENSKIEFEVYIVGTGDNYKKLLKIVEELNLKDIVKFEGYQKKTETYYKKAHVTVVPSHFEPFGRVTVEAMMSESFVIGSDTAATVELIGNDTYGKLFKCGDANELAEALIWAFNNPIERQKKAKKAKEYAEKFLSAESNASAIYEVYKKMINIK